jgi:hypothetical protein
MRVPLLDKNRGTEADNGRDAQEGGQGGFDMPSNPSRELGMDKSRAEAGRLVGDEPGVGRVLFGVGCPE